MVKWPTCHQTTICTLQIVINSTGVHPRFTHGEPRSIPWHRWRHTLSNDVSHGNLTHHPTDPPDMTTPTQTPQRTKPTHPPEVTTPTHLPTTSNPPNHPRQLRSRYLGGLNLGPSCRPYHIWPNFDKKVNHSYPIIQLNHKIWNHHLQFHKSGACQCLISWDMREQSTDLAPKPVKNDRGRFSRIGIKNLKNYSR